MVWCTIEKRKKNKVWLARRNLPRKPHRMRVERAGGYHVAHVVKSGEVVSDSQVQARYVGMYLVR